MNKFLTLYTPSRGAFMMPGWSGLSAALLVTPVRALASLLLGWQNRLAAREALAGMSPRLLDDVALDRADALRESWKPFWRI